MTDSSTLSSPSVNDNVISRLLVLSFVQLLKHVKPRKGDVLLASKRICIKYGRLVQLSEASSIRFISQRTSIPVPKVICAFEHRGVTYIVMERIDGQMVGSGWLNRSVASRTKILTQLRGLIQQMRDIPAPSDVGVANVDGGAIYDCRLPGPSLHFGPFRDVAHFHHHLRRGFEHDTRLEPEINRLIDLGSGQWSIVFTHGDLSSLNILVQGDKVVGIVDWETAGWYPAYWEYTTACQVNPQNLFWREEIDRFLQPFPAELEMERIRSKYFGDY